MIMNPLTRRHVRWAALALLLALGGTSRAYAYGCNGDVCSRMKCAGTSCTCQTDGCYLGDQCSDDTDCGGGSVSNSVFLSQSVPSCMVAGQSYNVSVQWRNSGTTTWTYPLTCSGGVDCGFKMGSQNPPDNLTWGGRVFYPGSVPPGAVVTLPFTVTAPATAGTHNFQWRLLQENIIWFGQQTPNVSITVVPSGSSCGQGAACSPCTMNAECSSNSCVSNVCGPCSGNTPPDGWLDSVDCTSIQGWAYDPNNSSASIQVHVYSDGAYLTAGTADGVRTDVNAALGISGNHGYIISTPSSLMNGVPHSIVVYGIDLSGGTNAALRGTPMSVTCSPISSTLTVNGAMTTTVTPGGTVSYAWSSTGATSGNTTLQVLQGGLPVATDACSPPNTSGNFSSISGTSGAITGTAGPCQQGFDYRFRYTVSGPAGTAFSTADVVIPLGADCTADCTANSQCASGRCDIGGSNKCVVSNYGTICNCSGNIQCGGSCNVTTCPGTCCGGACCVSPYSCCGNSTTGSCCSPGFGCDVTGYLCNINLPYSCTP